MNSWLRSACYPRRTFYPLSDGPSIQNHRITKTYFRTCSTCLSRSQAPLCLCTHCAISDRAEGTFALLRYTLGGVRPSQTTHHSLFLALIHTHRLLLQAIQGVIVRLAPRGLAASLHCLPPILHSTSQSS